MTAAVPFALPPEALRGRVAVITGASRGLGASLAERFAGAGLRLGLCARTRPEIPAGAEVVSRSVDVADAAALEAFAAEVTDTLGPVDLWVNNAGVLEPMGPLREATPEAIDRALLVNVAGVAHGSAAFLRSSAAPRRRVLVNLSSGAAKTVYPGWAIYGATKAAVEQLTATIAAEEPDVVCRAVAPGVVDTDMQALIRTHDEESFPAIERFRELHRTGDWNDPSWIADHLLGLLAGTWEPQDLAVRIPNPPR